MQGNQNGQAQIPFSKKYSFVYHAAMRLFVAIDLPDETREACRSFRREKLDGAKWVAVEQIHLTLRFIGESSEEQALALRSALQGIHARSFPLRVRGLGCFPGPKRPRVLWLGLEVSQPLLNLQASIENMVQSVGFLPEPKSFSPHLSLARFRFSLAGQVQSFLEKYQAWGTSDFTVTSFFLYSSLLLPQGAKHEKLEEFILA